MKPIFKNLQRLGCGLLVAFWFVFLVIVPCSAITLGSGGEIQLTHSNVPDDNTLRIWLIQQPHLRGLGISTGYLVNPSDQTACTVTNTRFILWEGSAESVKSCACYDRQPDGSYAPHSIGADACQFAGQ